MMKLTVPLLLPLASALASVTQDDAGAPKQPVPLKTVECEEVTEVPPGEFDAELWAARLSEGDLDLRMAAFEAIVDAGMQDDSVYQSIQGWAADLQAGELAWTARMALRELERRPVPAADPWGFGSGLDWFRGSPFQRLGMTPEEIERNLQSRLDQLHRQMQQGFAPGAAPGRGLEQRSFSFELGPEGLRVRTHRRGADGEDERQWEAESIEELLKAHPELESEFPGLEGLRMRFGVPKKSEGQPAPVDAGPRTDVLGVECRNLGPEELKSAGQAGSVIVMRILPGSIADELGVRRGDVLLAINGGPIDGPEDITQALMSRAPSEPIRLSLIDAAGKEREMVWSPSPLGVWED